MLVVATLIISALAGWWLAGESDDFCKRANGFFEGLLLHVMGMIPGLSQLGLKGSLLALLGSEETPLEPRYGDAVMYSLLRKLTKTRMPTGKGGGGGVRNPTINAAPSSQKNSTSSLEATSTRIASGSSGSDGDSISDQGLDALLTESVLESMVQEALRDASSASSSSSSLPPPQSPTRLSGGVDEVPKVDKPILVLDLDETLIHSSVEPKSMCNHSFTLFDEEQRQYFFVFKRPFVETFLHLLAHHYDIAVFTASYSCYSDPILDFIDPKRIISRRLHNTSLVQTPNNGFQKDLSVVSQKHIPKRLIMIDNSPLTCLAHHENLYVVSSFRANNNHDLELLALVPLLLSINNVSDVRSLLHRRVRFS